MFGCCQDWWGLGVWEAACTVGRWKKTWLRIGTDQIRIIRGQAAVRHAGVRGCVSTTRVVSFVTEGNLDSIDTLVRASCLGFSSGEWGSSLIPVATGVSARLANPVCPQSTLCWLASSLPNSGALDVLCNALQHCPRFSYLGLYRTVFGGRGQEGHFASICAGGCDLLVLCSRLL